MKTWFITGVSSGFGRAIANAALAAGDRVVGTLRNDEQRKDFAALAPRRLSARSNAQATRFTHSRSVQSR